MRNYEPNLIDSGEDWVVCKSEVVSNESEEMKVQLGRAYRLFKNTFTGCDSSLKNDGLTLDALPDLFSQVDARQEDMEQLKNMKSGDLSGYRFYNVFNLTSPSPLFYHLLKEISPIVRKHLGNSGVNPDDPLWMQCWMNFHKPDQVLDWHDHHFPWHGYISIDPKDSITKFREYLPEGTYDYNIHNKIGNIYLGPGFSRMHKVVVNNDYEGDRITLGFDIITQSTLPDDQFSLIPLL